MKKLKIGNVTLDNPFLMAPLAGITDAPYRLLCRRYGAALVYSEMVSAKGLYYKDKKTDKLLYTYKEEEPVAYQIFGSEPEIMAYAAKELDSRENVILDVNMGCPVPKVVKNGDGSALLKDPNKIYEIVKAMKAATSKPITCKIRIGFDNGSFTAIEAALAIQEAGGAAVAVHGRTREQYYSGKADWEKIAKVKEAIRIPLIGNGDVTSWEDAKKMFEETNADFIMIGRAALGNPWIFRELTAGWNEQPLPKEPTLEEKKKVILEQLDLMSRLKGREVAVKEMRKFIGWYTKGMPNSASLRGKINAVSDFEIFSKLIDEIGQ